MRNLLKQRKAFDKDLLAQLGPLLKQTPWKKKSCILFTQSGDYYQQLHIVVYLNAEKTKVTLSFKPMALDCILWDILGMPENQNEPLSFRSWGAFTCSGIPILEVDIEQPGQSPAQVAVAIRDICTSTLGLFQERLSSGTYSGLVAAHPNQVERNAYGDTLLLSLINEEKYELARLLASSSPTKGGFSSSGKSLYQLALEWLDAETASKEIVHAAAKS